MLHICPTPLALHFSRFLLQKKAEQNRDRKMSNKPVRATYVSLYGRPESDAEFVSSMTAGGGRRRPALVDSYSCRQMYLRSYTFSTSKESILKKTKRCLEKVKDHAGASLRAFPRHRSRRQHRRIWIGEKKKKKTKGCAAAVRRLSRVPVSAVSLIFRRLLTCTTTADVAAGAASKQWGGNFFSFFLVRFLIVVITPLYCLETIWDFSERKS